MNDPYLQKISSDIQVALSSLPLPSIEGLEGEVQRLAEKYDTVPKKPHVLELGRFWASLQSDYNNDGPQCIRSLTAKSKKWLPWIMFYKKQYTGGSYPVEWPGLLDEIIDDFKEAPKWSHLLPWIHVFFENYDPQQPYCQKLGKFIHDHLAMYSRARPRLVKWKNQIVLFSKLGPQFLGKGLFKEAEAATQQLGACGFEGSLFFCSYLNYALQYTLKEAHDSFPEKLDETLGLLEVEGDNYKKPRSTELIRVAADTLIEKAHVDGTKEIQEKLQVFFLRHLGDPRLAGGRTKWQGVSQKAIQIFGQWISREHIQFFFNIVDRSALDRHWKYRSKFWLSYLDNIQLTWIAFGSRARNIIRSSPELRRQREFRNYGELRGGESSQSVILIRIGGYDFLEWSNTGACRVWKSDETPFDFGQREYQAMRLRNAGYTYRQTHNGSERYKWQHQLGSWIQRNTGINSGSFYLIRGSHTR